MIANLFVAFIILIASVGQNCLIHFTSLMLSKVPGILNRYTNTG